MERDVPESEEGGGWDIDELFAASDGVESAAAEEAGTERELLIS